MVSSTCLKNIIAARHVKGAWVGNYLSPEVRRLGREIDHSLPCSAKIKIFFFLEAAKEAYLVPHCIVQMYSIKSSFFVLVSTDS